MTICGVAVGSSHGRSATGFCWLVIISVQRAVLCGGSEVSWGGELAPFRVEERAIDDPCANHPSLPYQLLIEIDFRPQAAPALEMRSIEHSQRDVTFAGRRPARRADTADLALTRALGIQQGVVRRLVPLDVESRQTPLEALAALRQQGPSSREMPFVEVHQPLQTELERRAVATGALRMSAGDEIQVRLQEAGFDPRDVESPRADRTDAARAPRGHECIPDRYRVRRAHPQLVTQIARETGTGDGERDVIERAETDLEGPESLDAPQAERLQHGKGCRSLQRERGDLVRHFLDPHSRSALEADRAGQQPVELPVGCSKAIFVLPGPKDRPIIDDVACIIAPDTVGETGHLEFS